MRRILFVDDEENILDGLRRSLRNEKNRWELHFAASGEAALESCKDHSFDVVVSDMRMPGMDGATLLGLMRDRYPETARIILSGYSEEVLATRALSVAHRCLSKPCPTSELHQAIEQVCALQEMLRTPAIRKVVGSVSELPSLSTTYVRLLQALKEPDASIDSIVAIIHQDIAMSAKVLQIANSAFFGLPRNATTLHGAATYLGTATLKNLVLASEAFRVFVPHSGVSATMCESLQRHSYATAQIATGLPVAAGFRDVIMIAALLHDIGRLFLASVMPDEYCAALLFSEEQCVEPFEAEEKMLGASHAEIGAYLMGLWGIPFPAVEAIAHHHHPTRLCGQEPSHTGHMTGAAAIYCADLIAHEIALHPDDVEGKELQERDRSILESLELLNRYPGLRAEAFRTLAATGFS